MMRAVERTVSGFERALSPEALAALPDEEIDFSDIPELDEDFFKRSEPMDSERNGRYFATLSRRSLLVDFKFPGMHRSSRVLNDGPKPDSTCPLEKK